MEKELILQILDLLADIADKVSWKKDMVLNQWYLKSHSFKIVYTPAKSNQGIIAITVFANGMGTNWAPILSVRSDEAHYSSLIKLLESKIEKRIEQDIAEAVKKFKGYLQELRKENNPGDKFL